MGFQRTVNNNLPLAVEGDFASANLRASVLAGPGALKAPAGGLRVGYFAWANTDTGEVSQSYRAGFEIGFLHRENQAVITEYLGEDTMVVQEGFMVTLMSQGDFYARFPAAATPGQAVYADPSTGRPQVAASAASVTALAGATFTGVVAGNVLTASAVTGVITPGDTVLSASIVTPTVIGAQLTGTPGGAGTYTFVHADVASEAMTAYSLKLQVTAVGSGSLGVGSTLTGSGVAAGTVITAQDSGTPGGIGVYSINERQQFASTTVTEAAVLTPWTVNSPCLADEVAKISTWG